MPRENAEPILPTFQLDGVVLLGAMFFFSFTRMHYIVNPLIIWHGVTEVGGAVSSFRQ